MTHLKICDDVLLQAVLDAIGYDLPNLTNTHSLVITFEFGKPLRIMQAIMVPDVVKPSIGGNDDAA